MGMTTKNYLSQIERLDRVIQNKLSEIAQLRKIATSISTLPKDINVQRNSDTDKIGNTIARIVDLERETDMLVDKLVDMRQHIIEQIDGIKDTNMYHVLFERYVARKGWNIISSEMGYTFRNTIIIHGRALKEFEKLYGKEYL